MKRVIEIATRGIRLRLDNARLVIQREDDVLASVPVEDIGVVILDSTGISVSSGALKALTGSGAVVMACDDSHHPVGLFLPLQANGLHGERIRLQAAMSLPFRKQIWARIIQAKIANQAMALPPGPNRDRLFKLASAVRSGDSGHCESQASRLYWGVVFSDLPDVPAPFRRHRDGSPPNGLLNYGYAIIRAAMARALCGSGLLAGLGLHHRNRYNQFCLADDMMEPFRPFVDDTVREVITAGELEVNKRSKAVLLGVLERQVILNGKTMAIHHAIERSASSLAKSLVANGKEGHPVGIAARMLQLPAFRQRDGS